MPEPVSNNAVCEGQNGDSSLLLSFGGIGPNKNRLAIHQRCFRYNSTSDKWMNCPDLPDTLGKIAAAASSVGDTAYIIGGYHVLKGGREVSSDRVHRYVISKNTFITDGEPIPKAIDDQVQMVWKNRFIYVITGWRNTENVVDVWLYDTRNNSWSACTALPEKTSRYAAFGASGTILGDTIYYYSGAGMGFNFPGTRVLRKGYIDQNDPTQIAWSFSEPVGAQTAYRSASFSSTAMAHWIGGSVETYNYDGLAYKDGRGVEPASTVQSYHPKKGQWTSEPLDLPMDLRGLAKVGNSTLLVAGGMEKGQKVSAKTFKVEFMDPLSLPERARPRLHQEAGQIRLTFPSQRQGNNYTLSLLDLSGRKVWQHTGRARRSDVFIKLPGLITGVYMATVLLTDGTHSSAWVIIR